MVVDKVTPVFFMRTPGISDISSSKSRARQVSTPNNPGSSAILHVANPIIALSALLGMAPVQSAKPRSDNETTATTRGAYGFPKHPPVLQRSVWLEIYSMAILGCVTAASYLVFKDSSNEYMRLNTLTNVLIYASGLLTAVVAVLVQVATLYKTRSAIDSLTELIHCEEETQTMSSARVRKARIWVVVQFAIWGTVSILFAGYHFVFEVPHPVVPISFCFRAYALARPCMHISCIQFANQAHALSIQLSSITDRLLDMLGPLAAGLTPSTLEMWSRLGDSANPLRQPPMRPEVEADALETTRKLRLLHHKMHVTAGYLQSAYGPQMLLILLSTLVDYTTMLYILLARIEIGVLGVVSLLIGTIHVLVMYLVLTAGNLVREEAQRMGEILQRGLVHRRLSEKLVEELQDFSLQLIRLPTRLSACGLKYIDYSMIQGAVGTITTYLVIMLQLPGAGKEPATCNNNNKTIDVS